MKSYRNDRRYTAQRDALKRMYKAQGLPCVACGHGFLWEFEDRKQYPDFRKDARSFTADHMNMGGRMAPGLNGLQGMHRACNSSKGDGSKGRKPKPPNEPPPPLKTRGEW